MQGPGQCGTVKYSQCHRRGDNPAPQPAIATAAAVEDNKDPVVEEAVENKVIVAGKSRRA